MPCPLLAAAGSGLATLGIPASAGVTSGATRDTIVCPYNDVDAVAAAVERHGEGLAAIVVEPVAGNAGSFHRRPASGGAARAVRQVGCVARLRRGDHRLPCRTRGCAGAVRRLPDLTVLGKIVGGGLPLAAFGGRADVMERLAPIGDVYQAGTLSGNPLATAAGCRCCGARATFPSTTSSRPSRPGSRTDSPSTAA